MQTKVTFRHMNGNHPELHDLAVETADSFRKFHEDIISTNVEFINEAIKTVQFTLHIQGATIVGKDSTDDFHKSLNEASEKVKRQLKKWKTKRIAR
ncbi:MAG: ribosome hibernation-promoting factor, HPF/YfiA family [Candidatus Kapaibacterium sp.]